MKTIQMTIDESLLTAFDQSAKELKTSRSALIREAMQHWMRQRKIQTMEEKHRRGYEKHPQDDLSDLIAEQVWEDDGEDWSQYYDAG